MSKISEINMSNVTNVLHVESTWNPLDSIWNAGISTLDSMEQIQFHGNSAGIPRETTLFDYKK